MAALTQEQLSRKIIARRLSGEPSYEKWNEFFATAAKMGEPARGLLSWLIGVLRAICARVAHLCEVQAQFERDRHKPLEEGAADQPSADGGKAPAAPGMPAVAFVGEPKKVELAARVALDTFKALIKSMPDIEAMRSGNGVAYLNDTLRNVDEQIALIKAEHAELVAKTKDLFVAAGQSMGGLGPDEAFQCLLQETGQEGLVDPRGEIMPAVERIRALEGALQSGQRALASCCVAAMDYPELKPIATRYLGEAHHAEIREIFNSSYKIQPAYQQSDDKSGTKLVQSRNELSDDKVVQFPERKATLQERATELPAGAVPEAPASLSTPAGVTRFSLMNRGAAGDMSMAEDEPSAQSQTERST
jgi:hypothetical protein